MGEAMDKVLDFLKNEVCLKEEDKVVVGVSGGPDSMFLLYTLVNLRKKINFKIICSHVNHNVRRESAKEKVFIENWCKDNNVFFESMKIENYSDDNFHNEARTIRYQFFENVIKKYNANYLMTAHHGDDLIETVLMRIVRGSTLKGYSGFEKVIDMNNYKIVRPLIYMTKEEIESYMNKNKIPYVIDKSNFKNKYTRNRYRHTILPFLKEEDSKVNDKFLKFSEKLLECNKYVDKEVNKVFDKVYRERIIYIDKLLELDRFIQEQIIYRILEDIYHDDVMLVNDRHVELILELVNSNKKNSFIYLPNSIKVVKEYDVIKITNDIDEISDYEIELSDYVILPNGKHIERVESIDENGNDIARFSSSDIELPIYIRTRKLGDKIDLNGMLGHRKVKDIFIDKKVPLEKRDLWPIVVDSKDKVLWIPGIKKSKKCKKKSEKCDIILKYY